MCVWCCWKDLDEQDLMENLFGKIWIQDTGNTDFKVISATEKSNKFHKTKFWKEISVEKAVTLESLPFNSSMTSFHIWLFKKSIHTFAKKCSHVEFPYFVMGSQATLVYT
jgi:hypothetical protein